MDRSIVPNYASKFQDLQPPLSASLLESIKNLGLEYMTPVQFATLSNFPFNKDVIVEAVTGSGKTLAFLLSLIQMLGKLPEAISFQALVLAPTKELCNQIFKVFVSLDTEISAIQVHGGEGNAAKNFEKTKNEKPRIIFGTPGRVLELFEKGLPTNKIEILILDEADRLLSLGFKKSMDKIFSKLPKQKRVGAFSATMTDALEECKRTQMRNPIKLVVKVQNKNEVQRIPTSLRIEYIKGKNANKLPYIIAILRNSEIKKLILYFNTCACVDYFSYIMKKLPTNFNIFSFHGKMNTNKRKETIKNFENSTQKAILITTDVASRGLDIPSVDCVVQYDLPQDPNVFSHRSGRTARAGNNGISIFFINEGKEEIYLEFLKLRKIPTTQHECEYINENDLAEITKEIEQVAKSEIMQDREILDKSVIAFVSFIKSYTKHEASYIFSLKNMDFEDLMKSFFLQKVPKMPELKNIVIKDEWVNSLPDTESIEYKNKQLQQKRNEVIEEYKLKHSTPFKASNINKRAPWSKNKLAKEKKIKRREYKLNKKLKHLENK